MKTKEVLAFIEKYGLKDAAMDFDDCPNSIIAYIKFGDEKVLEYRLKLENKSVDITYSDFSLYDDDENWLEYKVNEKEASEIRERVKNGVSIDEISREYAERIIKEKEAEYEKLSPKEKYLMLSRRAQENSLMLTAMSFMSIWESMGAERSMISDNFASLEITEKLVVFCDWAREYVYECYDPEASVSSWSKQVEEYLKTRLSK